MSINFGVLKGAPNEIKNAPITRKALGAPCQEPGQRPKKYVSYYKLCHDNEEFNERMERELFSPARPS